METETFGLDTLFGSNLATHGNDASSPIPSRWDASGATPVRIHAEAVTALGGTRLIARQVIDNAVVLPPSGIMPGILCIHTIAGEDEAARVEAHEARMAARWAAAGYPVILD